MTGLLVLLGTLVLAAAGGTVFRARNGRMRPAKGATASAVSGAAPAVAAPAPAVLDLAGLDPTGLDLAELGLEPGARATLLQFSSAFCAPCRATRTMLRDVASAVPGVAHLEVDVADGDAVLDLVRRLDIRRTPTTLVLDANAREVRRASGVPRREQVVAAVAEAAEAST